MNMRLNLTHATLIVVLIASVSGCGFKLRGTAEPLPDEVRQLVLTGVDQGSAFYRKLSGELIGAGAILERLDSAEKPAILTIHKVMQSRDEISDSGGETLYRSSFMVTFSLGRSEGGLLIDSRRLRASREFSFDSNNPYGLEQQDKLLRNELQRDLIQQLIGQIRAAALATSRGKL